MAQREENTNIGTGNVSELATRLLVLVGTNQRLSEKVRLEYGFET